MKAAAKLEAAPRAERGAAMKPPRERPRADYDLVVIGASLGGVAALRHLLAALPAAFPAAIAIVQHRRHDADSPLPQLLGAVSLLPVREPRDRERLEPGVVYLGPAGYHLLVEPGWLTLSVEGPVSWARPSIDVLFESAADAYRRRVVAVLLTGSSEDGAAGVAAVARRGGLTVVEDPGSAHSPVSPAAALQRTKVRHVLPLEGIGALLCGMVKVGAER
ncbi:MAG TPA: chemotaxis protein CheB [Thermoanaerobaculia bacterium]|jgi:two-component system chemotaxis response regulator CheB|nr:chemotaxis protein CheB [Thermoanaerobaculia bacterium]